MKITIAAAGRFRGGPEKELYQKYIERLPWQISLSEVDERHFKDKRKQREQAPWLRWMKSVQACPAMGWHKK
jgi:hypothetical protein